MPERATSCQLAIAELASAVFGHGYGMSEATQLGMPVDRLRKLQPYAFFRLLDILIAFDDRTRGKVDLGKLATRYQEAANLLIDWPRNLYEMFDEIVSVHGRNGFVELLFTGSRALFSSSNKADLRLKDAHDILADVAYDYLSSGPVTYVDPRLRASVFGGREFPWMTSHRFAASHQVAARRLGDLQRQGQIGIAESGSYRRVLVSPIGDDTHIKASLERVNLKELARSLQIPVWACKSVLLNGVIESDSWKYEGKGIPERITSLVERRLADIARRAVNSGASVPRGAISIRELLSSSRHSRSFKEDVLSRVVSGRELTSGGKRGFFDMYVQIGQRQDAGLAHELWKDGAAGWVPASTAAGMLMCTGPTVVHMVDSGIIRGVRIGSMRRVSLKALHAHFSRYVSLGELSAESGLSTSAVRRILELEFPKCRSLVVTAPVARAGTRFYVRKGLPDWRQLYGKMHACRKQL